MVTFNRATAPESAADGFQHGQALVRQRRRLIFDERKGAEVPGSWDQVDVIPLPGAYLESGGSSQLEDATRSPVESTDRIVLTNNGGGFADVRSGDRIVGDGRRWEVTGVPGHDRNPFSGWEPYLYIRVKEATG